MVTIATNTAANSAARFLNMNSSDAASSVSKLASGSRIVRASDDASGLAISTRLSSDSNVLKQAATNASQASSILQIADGGLSNISDTLQRMKSLAAQSLSGVPTDTERAYIDVEYQELSNEIDGIANTTRFNGDTLLNGNGDANNQFGASLDFFVGTDSSDVISVDLTNLVGNPGGGASESQMEAQLKKLVDNVFDTLNTATNGGFNLAETDNIKAALSDAIESAVVSTGVQVGDLGTLASNLQSAIYRDVGAAADGNIGTGDAGALANAAFFTTPANDGELTTDVAALFAADAVFGTGVDTTGGIVTAFNLVDSAAVTNFDAAGLSVSGTDVLNSGNASAALDAIDSAIEAISEARANVGALISRFDTRGEQIATSIENLDAANSVIKDVDLASEQIKLVAANSKTQAAVSALSQANQQPQQLLRILN